MTGLYYGFCFGEYVMQSDMSEGCDAYVYCRIGHQLGDDEDGGCLDFSRSSFGYGGDILNALPDAFDFLSLSVEQRCRLVYIPNKNLDKDMLLCRCPHITDSSDGGGVCLFDGSYCKGCKLGISYFVAK